MCHSPHKGMSAGDAVTAEVPPSAAPSATASEGHQTPQSSPRKAALSPGSLCLPVPHRQGGSAASHPRRPRGETCGDGRSQQGRAFCVTQSVPGAALCSPSRTQTLLGETLTHRGGLETPHATSPRHTPLASRSPPGTRAPAKVTQVEQGHHEAPGMFLKLQPRGKEGC